MRAAVIILALLAVSCGRDVPGDVQSGIASWYDTESCEFNKTFDCKTAYGDSLYDLIWDGNLFAAMRDAPYKSLWRVTSTKNGKSVIVEIRDVGPSAGHPDRIIDLSKKAFELIGDLNDGLLDVVVERVK